MIEAACRFLVLIIATDAVGDHPSRIPRLILAARISITAFCGVVPRHQTPSDSFLATCRC
jgi:hypothetical protein